MKRKMFLILIVAALATTPMFASFEGISSIGGSYQYREGSHLGGLSNQNFGFINDAPVGYFVGINAGFGDLADPDWAVNMLVGPAYSYFFPEANLSIDVALGASLSGQWMDDGDYFGLGIGGYLGATWHMTSHTALLLGATLGYDILGVGLSNGDVGFNGVFHVAPSLAVGFTY